MAPEMDDIVVRPETAEAGSVDFANVLHTSRHTPPFDIAQIGKSLGSEITPRNFVLRTGAFDTLDDQAVTIREREPIDKLADESKDRPER